jgi:hypothetical protein
MSAVLQSPKSPVPAVARRREATPRAATRPAAQLDGLLREMAYVYRLAEQVRRAIPGGKTLLPAGV